MATFGEVFITMSFIGILVFGGILFVANTQTENNLNNTILNDTIINNTYNDLTKEFNDFSKTANKSKNSFEEDNPVTGFVDLILLAIVGVGKTFTRMILGIYNIFIILPSSKLGVPPQVVSVLGGILIVSLVLLAWRLYRSGQ